MTLWCHKTTICYACIDRPCFYQTVAFLYLFSLSCLFVLASVASFAVYNFFNNFYFHNNVKLHRLSNSFIQYFLFFPFFFFTRTYNISRYVLRVPGILDKISNNEEHHHFSNPVTSNGKCHTGNPSWSKLSSKYFSIEIKRMWRDKGQLDCQLEVRYSKLHTMRSTIPRYRSCHSLCCVLRDVDGDKHYWNILDTAILSYSYLFFNGPT